MPVSMTGFGRGEYKDEKYLIIVELKSFNHRFTEFSFHIPRNLQVFEEKFRTELQSIIQRGKIDIFLQIVNYKTQFQEVRINEGICDRYYQSLTDLTKKYRLHDKPTLAVIANLPEVFQIVETEINLEQLWMHTKKALESAVSHFLQMRKNEGEKIYADIAGRLGIIEKYLQEIKEKSPLLIEEYKTRLQNNLAELLPPQVVDEYQNRLLYEIVLFSDKINTTEEIIRLESHISQFKEYAAQNYAVGRKLDFLIQEMNREINTIGSKTSDFTISKDVVEVKSELEKIREQVQNIE